MQHGRSQELLAVGDALPRWVRSQAPRRQTTGRHRTAATVAARPCTSPNRPVLPPCAIEPSLHTHTGPLFDKLNAEVRRLAATVPDGPHFLPHVTLLGGIAATEADVLSRAATLAKQLQVGGACSVHRAVTSRAFIRLTTHPLRAPFLLSSRSRTASPSTEPPAAPSSTSASTCCAPRTRPPCRRAGGRWQGAGRRGRDRPCDGSPGSAALVAWPHSSLSSRSPAGGRGHARGVWARPRGALHAPPVAALQRHPGRRAVGVGELRLELVLGAGARAPCSCCFTLP